MSKIADYSVLMSVYRKEKPENLITSVDSVMAQTIVPNDFVIVIDGPLGDDLYKALDLLKDKYHCINTIRLETNQGLGQSLTIGIKETKNDIVMRMDSDDICMPYRAEMQLPLMDKYDLVGGIISEFSGDEKNIIGYRVVPETYKKIWNFAKYRCPFNHPSVMYRKSVVLAAGNYQVLPYREDYYLWLRMLLITNKVYNIQEVLVNMRSGIEMRKRRSGQKEHRLSLKKLRKFMFDNKIINWFEYIFVSAVQNLLLSLPVKLKEPFYRKFLRKKSIKS